MILHYVHRFWALEKKKTLLSTVHHFTCLQIHISPQCKIYPFCFKIPKNFILLQHLKFEESANLVGSVEPLKVFEH